MSNPLDDALSELDRSEIRQTQEEEKRRQLRVEAVQRFSDLVEDFVRRMAAAGSPGTNWEMKEGLLRKVRGWSLNYELGDAWRRVPVRVDGLVPGSSGQGYISPRQSNYALSDKQLKTLAASMADVMRQCGVA